MGSVKREDDQEKTSTTRNAAQNIPEIEAASLPNWNLTGSCCKG